MEVKIFTGHGWNPSNELPDQQKLLHCLHYEVQKRQTKLGEQRPVVVMCRWDLRLSLYNLSLYILIIFFSEIQSLLFLDLRVCRRPSEMSRSGVIFHIKGHGHCWWSDKKECFETSSSVMYFNSTVCFYCIKGYFCLVLFSLFYTCFALAKIHPLQNSCVSIQ